MEIIPFVARTAAEAFARIQAEMGPEAVVLNVRQLPVHGLARLWRKPHIEVLACPPGLFHGKAPLSGSTPPPAMAAPLPSQPAMPGLGRPSTDSHLDSYTPASQGERVWPVPGLRKSRWRISSLLGTAGLSPITAQRLLDDIETRHGSEPPRSLPEEIVVLKETLRQLWTVSGPIMRRRPQILIGAAGAGKTTLLCKWLTKLALTEGNPVRVFRIDGVTANTAETLDVHAEILGVPVERTVAGLSNSTSEEWRLVDVPGVDWRDRPAIGELRRALDKFTGADVHLVLNGAYEVSVLLSQARAFSSLPITGLMVTHLDEENRWAKLWNLVLETPLPLRFLSAGPNIPGEFLEATPDLLNDRWLGGHRP